MSTINPLKNNKIKKILKLGYQVEAIKIIENLSESESLVLESKLISIIGRKDLNQGILCNMTDGGEKNMNQNRDKFKQKVDRTDSSGNIVTYNSIKEACEDNGNISKGNIVSCCRGKKLTYSGFIWSYNDIELKTKYNLIREKLLNKYKVIQFLDDRSIIFDSVKEASEYNNISVTCVIYSCKGITGKNSGYNFRYYSDEKHNLYLNARDRRNDERLNEISIIQLSLDGNFIKRWSSATKVYKELGYNASCINACCRGQRKTAGGFKWLYESEYIKSKKDFV